LSDKGRQSNSTNPCRRRTKARSQPLGRSIVATPFGSDGRRCVRSCRRFAGVAIGDLLTGCFAPIPCEQPAARFFADRNRGEDADRDAGVRPEIGSEGEDVSHQWPFRGRGCEIPKWTIRSGLMGPMWNSSTRTYLAFDRRSDH